MRFRFGISRRMTQSLLSAGAVCVLASGPAVAGGSKVLLKSDGSPDGYFYTLDDPSSPESRYITAYAPGDFDPLDVIIGARVAEIDLGDSGVGMFTAELRVEDPGNPGFPDLSADGLIAVSDPDSEGVCSSDPTYRREFTFPQMSAPPDSPLYLCVRVPGGQTGIDACG